MISYVFNVIANYNIHISPQLCIHILISKPDVDRRGVSRYKRSAWRQFDQIRWRNKTEKQKKRFQHKSNYIVVNEKLKCRSKRGIFICQSAIGCVNRDWTQEGMGHCLSLSCKYRINFRLLDRCLTWISNYFLFHWGHTAKSLILREEGPHEDPSNVFLLIVIKVGRLLTLPFQ